VLTLFCCSLSSVASVVQISQLTFSRRLLADPFSGRRLKLTTLKLRSVKKSACYWMMCESDAHAQAFLTNSCNFCICSHLVMFDVFLVECVILSICYIVTLNGRKRRKW